MPIVGCKICRNEFYVKPSHQKLGWGKYCSQDCRSKSQLNGKEVLCNICNKKTYRSSKELNSSKSGKYFCSKKCQTLWRNSIYIEDRNPNWVNGNGSYRDIMSRRKLLSKCLMCGISESKILIIHHLDKNRANNTVSNLKCLCHNCHFLVHHYKEFDDKLKNIN